MLTGHRTQAGAGGRTTCRPPPPSCMRANERAGADPIGPPRPVGQPMADKLLVGCWMADMYRRTFLGLYGSTQQCAYQMSGVHRPGPSWYPMWQRIAGAHLDPTVWLYHYSIIIVRGTSHVRASERPNLNWDLGAAIHALPSTPVTSTLIHQSVV